MSDTSPEFDLKKAMLKSESSEASILWDES